MNKIKLTFLTIFLVAGLLLGSATPGLAQAGPHITITQIDTSKFPQVTVYISVVDANGNPFPVDPVRLTLSENGVPVSAEKIQGIGSVQKLSTLLVMDVSGSMAMEGKLDGAREAATQFIDRMRGGDQVGIMAFNVRTNLVAPLTSDQAPLRAALAKLQAGENTALYDALVQAENTLAPVEGRKAIIALTDGLDNRSQDKPETVISNIAASGLSISIIGLGDPNLGVNNVTALDQPTLENLAAHAGGIYSYAGDASGLDALYANLQRNLQAEYAISYLSSVPLRDGVNRSLTVQLNDASASTPFASSQGKYNPGGLVPEVGKAARWIVNLKKSKKKKPVIKLMD
jgi:VWFA-related protein